MLDERGNFFQRIEMAQAAKARAFVLRSFRPLPDFAQRLAAIEARQRDIERRLSGGPPVPRLRTVLAQMTGVGV